MNNNRHHIYLRIARAIGLFSIARWMSRRKLRILGYHGIWFSDGHFGDFLFMSAEKFSERMTWLKRSGYHVIPISDAIIQLKSRSITPNSVVITIDDGWYGTYSHMLPILEKNQLPATLYSYSGAIESQSPLHHIMLPALIENTRLHQLSFKEPISGKAQTLPLRNPREKEVAKRKVNDIYWNLDKSERESFCRTIAKKLSFDYDTIKASRQFSFMTYDELSDAAARRLDIQLHTHTHKLDMENPASIAAQVSLNRSELASHVRNRLEHFCYPGGLYTREMFQYLEQCGVASAVTTKIGLVDYNTSHFELNRILDGETISLIEFEAELSGFMELVRKARKLTARTISCLGGRQ